MHESLGGRLGRVFALLRVVVALEERWWLLVMVVPVVMLVGLVLDIVSPLRRRYAML